ncbi:exodeoxyribonuclease V subunit beta [Methylovulum psychrotolerans]|uniref:RecBCD enzyme subunit RecB n=1 Tax=Methylovulum psychrotolerans TaxID=1704499 RepID=A0A1Z4BZL7_9GAMM|nr:exodeoxyribonuclease V subunit beta [Methylovulum psychrotolerans]ASF46744.1 exodeoxyribonuclease V subunit beta [Methylovulum psychrotolerans]
MLPEHFDPTSARLHQGVNLIEASAGTGKTYAIAMLVLRFVVENAISIKQVLVVTFTKAATEELKERIRGRLAEAKRALNAPHLADPAIRDWLEQLDIPPEDIRQRLAVALVDIDQAGIFTIHGFCQNVLHHYALETGQLFDAELTGDLASIKQACADDFWRQQMARPLWEVAVLTARFNTPDALLGSLAGFPSAGLSPTTRIKIHPEHGDLDAALNTLTSLAQQAASVLAPTAARLRQAFAEDKFKSSYQDNFELHYQALAAWLQEGRPDIPDPEAFALLTENGLLEALHGNKFRAAKGQTSAERKAAYLQGLGIDTAVFEDLAQAYQQIPLLFRRLLLETLRMDLDKRLQQMNLLSFDDVISRLADVLETELGAALITELRQTYQAALIDEFQDTDDKQWLIFSAIFAGEAQGEETCRPFLYLIGDPKQAIYKFRGADIYSYLTAQKQAEHRYTLDKNWRSQPLLVAAVNTLFRREQAFLLPDLDFYPVKAAKAATSTALYLDGVAVPPLMFWQLPDSDSKSGYWTAGKAAELISRHIIDEVVALLSQDYDFRPEHTPLQAKDIAILVRSNRQARDYQAQLRQAGVPAVINSTESVFASPEASDLYLLLQAVANPGDSTLLKQALTLSWLGLDGQSLYQLSHNEAELDQWHARFLGYYQDWQTAGLMAMLMELLERENIRLTIAQSIMAERQLTNLHHILELLQQAVLDEHLGMMKTLDWLRATIAAASTSGDENAQLRLESDDDAVKIVTMHRSKGLEYPVVFCPYLWQRNDRLSNETELLTCHLHGQMHVDLGSEHFETHRAQALYEEQAEDLRVFYVAVTRAKYRCYLVWGNVRSEANPNNSAMAWLLDFADSGFTGQQAILQDLADQAPDTFAYRLLTADTDSNPAPLRLTGKTARTLQARSLNRSLYTRWQMSSYTALSALSQSDSPELPPDKAREPANAAEQEPAELPRGAHTGNVVHDLLENNRFADLANGLDISEQRDKACLRYGLKLPQPTLLDELLQAVVNTPLSADPNFCLKNLDDAHCLKEMPFYLAMQSMDASQINRILQDSPAYQPLSSKQMCGFLTGFIDLICAYQGRFYVMDYKTNSLPDYAPDTLTHAMREHNYGLQYWLYTVVLHRYLQIRLPDYDYERHFGGVCYLFVRGMQPEQPMSGVYWDRPDRGRVEDLARLFAGG